MAQQESSTIPPLLNRFMSGLLRSPLHGIVSRSVMLITFAGRKSGTTYTTPISYLRELTEAGIRERWPQEKGEKGSEKGSGSLSGDRRRQKVNLTPFFPRACSPSY